MDRRTFLTLATVAPLASAIPVVAKAEEPLVWREVRQYTINRDELPIRAEFDTQSRMSEEIIRGAK